MKRCPSSAPTSTLNYSSVMPSAWKSETFTVSLAGALAVFYFASLREKKNVLLIACFAYLKSSLRSFEKAH